MEPYRRPLATVHHQSATALAHAAAPVVVRALREAGWPDGLVVDLGCGTGVFADELVANGYDVFGIDIAPAMIEIARTTAPGATFVCSSFVDFDFPDCPAVTAIGEVFNYAFDTRNNRELLAELFVRVRDALPDAGVFVFDLAGPGRVPSGTTSAFRETPDWSLGMTAEEHAKSMMLTRTITVFERQRDGSFRRDDETHTLYLHHPDDVVNTLTAAGFLVTTSPGYDNFIIGPGHTVFTAVKR